LVYIGNNASNCNSVPEVEAACLAPLPVELVDFHAHVTDGKAALLSWSTASEINNEGFEVGWSLDGRIWQTLGFVASQGNSQTTQRYQFLHENPPSGINYYRLKQLDTDGKSDYSNIQSVSLDNMAEAALKVFPNPVMDGQLRIYMQHSDGQAVLRLFDARGRLIMHQPINDGQYEMDINLPAGIYFLEIARGSEVYRERVVVN
jgi:hypothetical protein